MAHAVYQTPAIVLRTKNMRESNKLAVLYTRDFGLVYVGAQSIRKGSSKMKAYLQSYSLVDVDLVRGRDIWRLTGIHEKLSSLTLVESPWYSLLEKLSSIIERLCPGEEPQHDLWDEVFEIYFLVGESEDFAEIMEIILVARILNVLGYWSGEEHCVLTDKPYSQESLLWAQENKRALVSKINTGLADSQL